MELQPILIKLQLMTKARHTKVGLQRDFRAAYRDFLYRENEAFSALRYDDDDDDDDDDGNTLISAPPTAQTVLRKSEEAPFSFMAHFDPTQWQHTSYNEARWKRALSAADRHANREVEERRKVEDEEHFYRSQIQLEMSVLPESPKQWPYRSTPEEHHEEPIKIEELLKQKREASICANEEPVVKDWQHGEQEWGQSPTDRERILNWMMDDLEQSERTCRGFIVKEEANEMWPLSEEDEHIRELLSVNAERSRIRNRNSLAVILFTSESRMRTQMERIEAIERSELLSSRAASWDHHYKREQALTQVDSQEVAFRTIHISECVEATEVVRKTSRKRLDMLASSLHLHNQEIRESRGTIMKGLVNAHDTRQRDHLFERELASRRFIDSLESSSRGFLRKNWFAHVGVADGTCAAERYYRLAIDNEEIESRAALWNARDAVGDVIEGYRDNVSRSRMVLLGYTGADPLTEVTQAKVTYETICDVETLMRDRIVMEQHLGAEIIAGKMCQIRVSALVEEERIARSHLEKQVITSITEYTAAERTHQSILATRSKPLPSAVESHKSFSVPYSNNSDVSTPPMMAPHVTFMRDIIYESFNLLQDAHYRMPVVSFVDSVLAVGVTAHMDDYIPSPATAKDVKKSQESAYVWSDKELTRTITNNLQLYTPGRRSSSAGSNRVLCLSPTSYTTSSWLYLEECFSLLCDALGRVHAKVFPGDDVRSAPIIHMWSYQYLNYGLNRLLKNQSMPYVNVYCSTFELLSTVERHMPYNIFDALFLKQLTSKTQIESLKRRTNMDFYSLCMKEDGVPYLAFLSFLHNAGYQGISLLHLVRTLEPLLLPYNTVGLNVACRDPTKRIPMSFVLRGADCIAAITAAHTQFMRILTKAGKQVYPRHIYKDEDDAEALLAVSAAASECFNGILENTEEEVLQKLATKCLLLLVLYSTWLECDNETELARGAYADTKENTAVDPYWTRKVFHEADGYYSILRKNKTERLSEEKKRDRMVRCCRRVVSLFYDFFLNLRSRPHHLFSYMSCKKFPETTELQKVMTKVWEFSGLDAKNDYSHNKPLNDSVSYTQFPGGEELYTLIIMMMHQCLGMTWLNYAGGIDGVVTYYSQHYFTDKASLDASLFRRVGINRRQKVSQYYRIYDEVTRHVKTFNDLMDGAMAYMQKVWSGSRWLRSNIASNTGVPGLPPPQLPLSFRDCSRQLGFCMVSVWPHQRKEFLPFELISADAPPHGSLTQETGVSLLNKVETPFLLHESDSRSLDLLFANLELQGTGEMSPYSSPLASR